MAEASTSFDENKLASECIKMLLNNNFEEAKEIFNKHRESSTIMSAGASFRSFLEGLLTFQDSNLEKAMLELKNTQKMCKGDDALDSIKAKFNGKRPKQPSELIPMEVTIQNKIVIADCYLYSAVIYFLKQDVSGYVKGSWVLRKAWKTYERYYYKLKAMVLITQDANKNIPDLQRTLSSNGISKINARDVMNHNIDVETLNRIFGSVCFGFGLFNLFTSLMPARLLKVVNLMGFQSNRNLGLKALENASFSEDMKAPLATLSLLWYHTVARQFFAIDSEKINSGIVEAQVILDRSEDEFPDSSLVLFFKGRILRCKREITKAIATFDTAFYKADGLVELQLLCCYENGWCCLLNLQWSEALNNFIKLKNMSKWSLCYYTYLCALCMAMLGDTVECLKLMNEVPDLMKQKNNQLEIFIVRKAKYFLKNPIRHDNVVLHVFELLYLWRALPNCTDESLHSIILECEAIKDVSLTGLKLLVLGAGNKVLGNGSLALEYFKACMDVSDTDFDDSHIAPYACFELAEIMLEHSDTYDKGKDLLSFCRDNYTRYDFENRLQMRIHATEQRVNDHIKTK